MTFIQTSVIETYCTGPLDITVSKLGAGPAILELTLDEETALSQKVPLKDALDRSFGEAAGAVPRARSTEAGPRGAGAGPLAEPSTLWKWIGLGGRSGLRRTDAQALTAQRGRAATVRRGFIGEMPREREGQGGSGRAGATPRLWPVRAGGRQCQSRDIVQAESVGFAAELDVTHDRKLDIRNDSETFLSEPLGLQGPSAQRGAWRSSGEDRRVRESHRATGCPSLPQRGRQGEGWLSESAPS